MKTFILGLGLMLAMSGIVSAQDEELSGFSLTRLKKVELAKTAKGDPGECLSFDAQFSAPLQNKPSAMLDFVNSHLIEGVVSFVMDVVQVSPNRYKLNMKADPDSCRTLKSKTSKVNVTIESGVGNDGRQVLPDERSFHLSN